MCWPHLYQYFRSPLKPLSLRAVAAAEQCEVASPGSAVGVGPSPKESARGAWVIDDCRGGNIILVAFRTRENKGKIDGEPR
jgi:hypothetical protein